MCTKNCSDKEFHSESVAKIHLNDGNPAILGPLVHDSLIYGTEAPTISSLGLHGKSF